MTQGEFLVRLKVGAGIEKVDGKSVCIGRKFGTLTVEEKAAVLDVLAAEVFKLGEDGSLGPKQNLVVVDRSGNQVATFGADGLKVE